MIQYRPSVLQIPPYHAGKKSPGAIKLSSNENPLGPSPLALDAVNQAMAQLNMYPDGSALALKEALASNHDLAVDWFVLGNGSDELFSFAAGLVIEPGDYGITSLETFSQYYFSLSLFGAKTIQIPLTQGYYDLDTMAQSARDHKAKICYLCNPNNPTGTWYTHDVIRRWITSLGSSVLVVLDEAYGEYADDPEFPRSVELVKEFPNLVVTHTFSKIYGIAGLRVGYGIAQPELASKLNLLRSPFNINTLGQVGAAKALQDLEFVQKSLGVNKLGKARIQDLCTELNLFHYPTQGNFFCIDVAHVQPATTSVYEFFKDRGVTIRDLTSFHMPGWIRVTIGTEQQLDTFEQGLRDLVGG
jgi:histidinol-phosphate aminotransferase